MNEHDFYNLMNELLLTMKKTNEILTTIENETKKTNTRIEDIDEKIEIIRKKQQKDFYTVKDLTETLGWKEDRVRHLMNDPELETCDYGKATVVGKNALEAYFRFERKKDDSKHWKDYQRKTEPLKVEKKNTPKAKEKTKAKTETTRKEGNIPEIKWSEKKKRHIMKTDFIGEDGKKIQIIGRTRLDCLNQFNNLKECA